MDILPNNLHIRNFEAGDEEFKRILYATTREDLRQLPMSADYVAKLIAMQQQVHEAGQLSTYPHAEHWILEHHAAPIGRLVLDASGKDWRVVDLALVPAAQRQGHGRALLQAVQERAARQQARIGLAVARSNQAARQSHAPHPVACRAPAPTSDDLRLYAEHGD